MIEIPEPEWLETEPGDSFITEKEVKKAFGIDPEADTNRLIYQKAIPEPSQRRARKKRESPERLLWKVSDLRKVFKKD